MIKIVKPMEVNGPASVSQIFFRDIIFDCYNISIYRKGKVKDEISKKFVKPMEVNTTCVGFTNFGINRSKNYVT